LYKKATTSTTLPKLWSKNFLLLLAGNVLIYQGILMLIPTFPVYIKQIGGNDLQASLPFALMSISALIMRSISGNAADKYGRRPLLILGLFLLIFFNCSFLYVSAIESILILRFFQGIGLGISSTILATIMSDIVPMQRRGEGTGYYSVSIVIATSLATIIGIELMKYYDFMVVLLVSTALTAVGMILALGIAIPPIKMLSKSTHKKSSLRWSDLFEKNALLPASLCFLHSIALGGIMSFIMLYGKEIGVENTWIYFIGHISMILISRPFAGKLFDQKGHAVVIVPGIVLMLIGLTWLSYAHSASSLFIASCFFGLGYGAAHPSLQAWAINRSPANRKGAANGTFLSSLDLGYAVGAVLLGSIATNTNYAMMYRISTLFLVVFAGIYGYHLLQTKKTNASERENEENIA
jgi:MFS family permease